MNIFDLIMDYDIDWCNIMGYFNPYEDPFEHQLTDNINQVYKTPKTAKEKGADLFIIGRAIYNSKEPLQEIIKYKNNINL